MMKAVHTEQLGNFAIRIIFSNIAHMIFRYFTQPETAAIVPGITIFFVAALFGTV